MANDRNGGNKNESEMTPLERYLAKQKAEAAASSAPSEPKGSSGGSARASSSGTPFWGQSPAKQAATEPHPKSSVDLKEIPDEVRAVPHEPNPWQKREEPAAAPRTKLKPGGFIARFVAYLVDSLIVFAISLPVRGAASFTLWFFPQSLGDMTIGGLGLGSFLAVQVVTFFYYGWFYREKGATPGKMMMSLEIRQEPNGARMTYGTAYLRESIGKYLSSLIIMIGFFIALFREDGRALHDLIFGTEVVEKQEI